MAKKVVNVLKLQIPAGGANPSPPVGPALGQVGVNIMDFCNAFNSATQESEKGMPLPVVINVYEDKSFDFVVKTPPAAVLIRKALNIQKGSGEPNRTLSNEITWKVYIVPYYRPLPPEPEPDRWTGTGPGTGPGTGTGTRHRYLVLHVPTCHVGRYMYV